LNGNKREAAMRFVDGALQVVLTLLIIELGWGVAVLVASLFSSMSVFYAVGGVATAGSIFVSLHYFTQETELERKEYPDNF
jgi:hypothetical protein